MLTMTRVLNMNGWGVIVDDLMLATGKDGRRPLHRLRENSVPILIFQVLVNLILNQVSMSCSAFPRNVQCSVLGRVLLEGVLLEGVLLKGVLLEGVLLEGVLLEDVLIEGVMIEDVMLEGVLLEGVLLEGVLLEGVLLEGVLLRGDSRILSQTDLH
jgi:uncharacterized protein YjbI with pentapeptide repeats